MGETLILLISGGSLVGQSVLDALADRRSDVELVATNSVPTGISLFDFDAVYLTPETMAAPTAFERRFSEILALERPDLVIPCRDDDVAFLAEYKERRPEGKTDFCAATASQPRQRATSGSVGGFPSTTVFPSPRPL